MTIVTKTRAAVAGLIVAILVTAATSAQKPASKIPRMPDGKPDLSGVWITGALQLLIGEDEARKIQQADRAAGRTLPPPEPPPYNAEGEKQRQHFLSRRGIDDPMARCFISGVPRITMAFWLATP